MAKTKGNVVLEEIKVGDLHIEVAPFMKIEVKVVTLPIKTGTKWEWISQNIKTGKFIDYLVTEGYEHYGPELYNDERTKFNAVYNIFTYELAVLYGNTISLHTFEDKEEWTKISYNGDPQDSKYLHIQLDYDESMQLAFYPRIQGDESMYESKATLFDSNQMDYIPSNLTLVYNDTDFVSAIAVLQTKDIRIVNVDY